MSMNMVVLSGRLTKDIELKETEGGKPYCKFILAVPRNWEKKADYIRVSAWGEVAKNCSQYIGKGCRVVVHGTLSANSEKEANGEMKYYPAEVVVRNIEFVDFKDKGSSKA